jgi:hypothetical protein
MSENGRYYGKYRGSVFNNIDPENRGRIQAYVPDVFGTTPTSYALPCVPVTGDGSGAFFVPEIDAGVWIEFEQGDRDYPIWTGGFWGSTSELPQTGRTSLPFAPNMVLQTSGSNSVTVYGDETSGVTISAGEVGPTSPSISVTPDSIVIQCGASKITIADGSISLDAATISMNDPALVVTKG